MQCVFDGYKRIRIAIAIFASHVRSWQHTFSID
jgi:hypothetical protein